MLVVGLDSREGLTEEQLLALGTEDDGSRLTDTVLWVQVDATHGQVRMVSFPRDLAMTPDGAPRVKLNALHALGGPELLVSALEELVGADLDHYVEVDLAGFIRLADTLGGVEVCLRERMVDRYAGVDLPAGCQELSATQAAGFVRARRVVDEFGAGTAGRAARQQYFIRQAVAEAVSSATLTSPGRLRGLVGLARASLVVDQGFSTAELLRFATALRDVDPDRRRRGDGAVHQQPAGRRAVLRPADGGRLGAVRRHAGARPAARGPGRSPGEVTSRGLAAGSGSR